jgi:hypothetical protein
LAELAFGQKALDFRDQIRCNHGGCSLGLTAHEKGPSPELPPATGPWDTWRFRLC